MSSSLPYDTAVEKTVQQFGIGEYDSSDDGEHGEDCNKKDPKGKSLPDGGGSGIELPETMLSYPTTPTTFASVRHEDPYALWLARAMYADLPGEADRPPVGHKQVEDTVNDTVPSVSQSKLPNDGDNPSARSDYYDRMRQGLERAPDPGSSEIWADEDTGAYASESLPVPMKNDVEMDNELQPTGNAWSGRTVEDLSNAAGFPSTDYSENVDFDRSDLDGGGKVMASGQRRVSTNIALVQELTAGLIKSCGKKGLTRRHVLAFLKEAGKSQYFASDVIRCLKLSHNVHVKDVMDEFPITKTAHTAGSGPWTWFQENGLTPDSTLYDVLNLGDGVLENLAQRSAPRSNTKDPVSAVVSGDPDAGTVTITTPNGSASVPFTADMSGRDFVNMVQKAKYAVTLAAVRDKVVDLEILYMSEVDTAKELRRCAAALSDAVAITDRLGVSNG